MEEFTVKELEKIIGDGDFNLLIGKIENDFFDCKNHPYDLKNEHSKLELAKDVSSFANLNGGYILIGPKTKNSETHFGDEITGISLLDQNLVDPNQYKKVIKDWIYPDEIREIKVYWKISKDNNKGIIVIEIPTQKESLKPFLICKNMEEGKKISEIIFGYAERRGDVSDPKKIKDIYKIMRDGLLYDKNIESRFNNLESIMQSFSKKRWEEEQKNKDKDIIDKRVNENLQSYGDNNK
jgi:predicted HTH transcriptional regulator